MRSPSLSIGLTSYNYGNYIGAALDSILSQSFEDYELLVIDNASTDHTEEVLAMYDDSRIQIIRNERNMGPFYSGDLFLERARGTYMRMFCADDVMLPGVIEKQMSAATSIPNVALVTCDMVVADKDLNPIYTKRLYPGICGGKHVIQYCADCLSNAIGGPSNFLYPAALGKNLKIDQNLSFLSDLDLAVRIIGTGAYVNINEPGYLYRRHENTDTNRIWSYANELNNWVYFLNKHNKINFNNAINIPTRLLNEESEEVMREWWSNNRWNLPELVRSHFKKNLRRLRGPLASF